MGSRPNNSRSAGEHFNQHRVSSGFPRRKIVLRYVDAEFHRSAFKHGYDESAINHAVANALVVIDLDAKSDPPKVLAIGPDRSRNPLEVIWLELAGRSRDPRNAASPDLLRLASSRR